MYLPNPSETSHSVLKSSRMFALSRHCSNLRVIIHRFRWLNISILKMLLTIFKLGLFIKHLPCEWNIVFIFHLPRNKSKQQEWCVNYFPRIQRFGWNVILCLVQPIHPLCTWKGKDTCKMTNMTTVIWCYRPRLHFKQFQPLMINFIPTMKISKLMVILWDTRPSLSL